MPTIILEESLRYRVHKTLDVSQNAKYGRFRLVDCTAFLDHSTLRIKEFPFNDISNLRYATISFPWRGVIALWPPRTLDVLGTEGSGDPISLEVLRNACIAARNGGANYIWLDQLCILQARAHSDDKHAQIKRMHQVYRSCVLCIVIPGGLQRLVSLDEETPWVRRSWTLQESLSPPKVVVLFAWTLGPGYVRADDAQKHCLGRVEEVIPGQSAIAPLQGLVAASSEGFMAFFREDTGESLEDATCLITSRILCRRSSHARALAAAMAQEGSQDFKDNAVWQCAQLRTSSRPVDMVLSIMGMFGVTLPAETYRPDDRLRATIDLAKEILKQGRSASWLGVSFRLPPCRYLSTFSLFPRNHAAGESTVQTLSGPENISKFVGGECLSLETLTISKSLGRGYVAENSIAAYKTFVSALRERHDQATLQLAGSDLSELQFLPRGSMDDEGYLEFEALSIQVRPHSKDDCAKSFRGVDGRTWKACEVNDPRRHETVHFAIFLGVYKKYHPSVYDQLRPGDGNFAKLMVVTEHDAMSNRSHAVTFCTTRDSIGCAKLQWALRKFCVGGPEPLPRGEMEEQVVGYKPDLASSLRPDTHEIIQLGSRLGACSQAEVEEFFRRHPTASRFPHDSSKTSIIAGLEKDVQQYSKLFSGKMSLRELINLNLPTH
ncbi:hypothetical protein JVT61DRAFT_1756 [Boletus reticuloceps]|nr:hypothetical protein JVT61DRAFT_1756 [Boletus reticuloceps]